MKKLILYIVLWFPMIFFSQSIHITQVGTDTNAPDITWVGNQSIDTLDFVVKRAGLKNKIYKPIKTLHYVKPSKRGDSLTFHVIDTTLSKKAIYLYYIETYAKGKKIQSEVAMAHNFGLLPPTKFVSFKATPLKDRKAVKLNWTLNYTQTISSLSLYRSKKYDNGYKKIADIDPNQKSYIDVIPLANEPWFYYMEVHNFFGGKSLSVRIPAFATFSEKPFPPQHLRYKVNRDTIVFNWQNVGDNVVGYRVYRSEQNRPFHQLHNMIQSNQKQIIFKDFGKAVQNNTHLQYFVRNVSDGFVESNPTDTIDIYMPEHEKVYPPNQVDYIIDAQNNVKLLWVPSEKGKVFAYNVYLTTPDNKQVKLNDSLLIQNYYVDKVMRPKGKYVYEVEGVGFKNKLSQGKTRITVNRYKPRTQIILDLKKVKDALQISWKKPLGQPVKKIQLFKQIDNQKPIFVKSFGVDKDAVYTDKNVKHGHNYLYFLKVTLLDNTTSRLADAVEVYY